jgi:leucyl-tRNA synthetase
MMEFTNLIGDENGEIGIDEFKQFLVMLAPFAPHISEELWSRICHRTEFISIHTQSWPVAKKDLLNDEPVVIAVQINGKLRDTMNTDKEIGKDEERVVVMAKNSEKVKKFTDGKEVKKVIFIPGKLLNFVVSG